MGGYIGARAGSVGATLANIQDVTATDTSPEVTLVNNTHEDTDGGREGKIIFKGQQSGGEESTLAEIQASHDGTADDEKGDLIFRTNDGSDGSSPTERLRIDSAGSIIPATLGTNNTHLGDGAGESIASGGQRNTFVGSTSGQSTTTGDFNSAFGNNSLNANVTGTHNTAIGDFSLALNTGNENTAVGQGSLEANTSGTQNTAVGKSALASANTATRNTAIGYNAMGATTTATANVAVGDNALSSKTSTGNDNVAIGTYAASSLTTGANGVFIGAGSGEHITTGSKNTIIGRYNGNQGGLDIRTLSNNIVLSDGDGNPWFGRADWDNNNYPFFRVDNDTNGQVAMKIRHTVNGSAYGIGIQFPNVSNDDNSTYFIQCSDSTTDRFKVWSDGDVDNHDNSYSAFSDQKLKQQITDASSQWDDIKALQVRKYKMNDDVEAHGDSDDHWRLGVVAQELEASGMSGLVNDRPDLDENNNDLGTTTKSVKYSILYMKAVKALQEAMTKIETLETENTAIKARLDALEAE